MAEKVSGLIALSGIAILLCIFIPAASYTIYRTLDRKLRRRYRGWDLVATFLVTITTFGAMLYITIDAQKIYPRCATLGGNPQIQLCLTDRYDNTGPSVEMPRDQASTLMLSDLFADTTECVIVPSALGIALVIIFGYRQSTRTQSSDQKISNTTSTD